MPKKLRELKAMLRQAGFVPRAGKGSHMVWSHPDLRENHYSMLIEWSEEDGTVAHSRPEGPAYHL